MRNHRKFRLLAATALMAPFLLAAPSGANAGEREADFYLKSAERMIQAKDYRGAEIQLRNAVQRAPQDGAIRMQLAELYMVQGNASAAEAELLAAKQRGVTDERLAMLLAEAMFRSGRFGEMLREVPAGNRQPETEGIVRTYRGLAELAIGRPDAAVTMLEDAERLTPRTVGPKLALARYFLSKRDMAAAGKKIDEALAIAPKNSQALDVKGVISFASGNADEALELFNQALRESPTNTQAMLDRANVYLERGDLARAEADVKRVQQIGVTPMAGYLEALIHTRRANYQAADAAITRYRGVMDRIPEMYFLAGLVKYNLNQLEQANDLLSRYVAQRKDKPQPYQLLGAIALRQGNNDRAAAMLGQARDLAPQNSNTLGLLGQVYLAQGNARQAAEILDQAVKAQPDNTELRTGLAVSRFSAGETGIALTELNDIFDAGSGNQLAGPPLVLASLQAGRANEAAATAEALTKKDPKNILYQQLLGASRAAQRNFPAAEKIYRDLLTANPNQSAFRQALAQIYLAQGRLGDAKKLFEDRIATNRTEVPSLMALAALYTNEKNYDDATKTLKSAISAAPAEPGPRFQLVSVYETQKKWPEAIAEARNIVTRFSGNQNAREVLARIYLNSGDIPNGVATYRDATRAFPSSAALFHNYGVALTATNDFAAATAALSKAIELEPTNDQRKAELVRITYETRGGDAALLTARSFVNPESPIGDLLVADVLEQTGKRNEAIAALEKRQAAKAVTSVALKLSELYSRNNNYPRAIAILDNWSKAHPTEPVPRIQLATLHSESGNYTAAESMFQKLAAERPSDPVVLNNLAWLYGKRNDARAVEMAQRAYQLAPNSPGIADTLGWLLLSKGDVDNATRYLKIASDALPDNPDVQYHYAVGLSRTNKAADARALLQKALASKDAFESRGEAKQLLDRLALNQPAAPRAGR